MIIRDIKGKFYHIKDMDYKELWFKWYNIKSKTAFKDRLIEYITK